MANIGEALTISLARERLEAIKKCIPVRDSVRQKLQLRQQVKEGFTEHVEELFKPVTNVNEAVKTVTVGKENLILLILINHNKVFFRQYKNLRKLNLNRLRDLIINRFY